MIGQEIVAKIDEFRLRHSGNPTVLILGEKTRKILEEESPGSFIYDFNINAIPMKEIYNCDGEDTYYFMKICTVKENEYIGVAFEDIYLDRDMSRMNQ